MDRKNKTIIWLLLFIFIIVTVVSLATYAYFTTKEYFYGDFEVDINSKGVDVLEFNGDQDVNFEANADNFDRYYGHDVSGSSVTEVKLTTTNNQATYCYELSVELPNIPVFSYSKPGVPELLLNVSESEDKENYTKIIDNMDITISTGVIKVPTKLNGTEFINSISAFRNEETKKYWKVDITLVWFDDVYQAQNDNKTYSAKIKTNRVEC